MDRDLISSLQAHFGFQSFRPGQLKALEYLLNDQHVLVVMPTGSGKSLVYQLAALHLPGVTLVISPLIALMKDQVDRLASQGLPATFINSALSSAEQNQRLRNMARGGYRIIYVAPERLRSTQFVNAMRSQQISLLAVDEAHCISEWGHDFRPDYLHIAQFRQIAGDPLTAALTATATPQVQEDIARLLRLPKLQRVVTGFNRPNLALEVRYIPNLPSRLKAVQELVSSQTDGASIIYAGTRRDAEEVAEFARLIARVDAQHYHAGLPAEQRSQIQEAFMAGELSTIVATNAFGMGIDRRDVRQVIHYSLPGSLEAYYQEAGRAGRDGLPARAVLLYSPEDRALQEWFIEQSEISRDELKCIYEALLPASKERKSIALEEVSCLSSLSEVKVRVGLAELERASLLKHLGEEGMRIQVGLDPWDDRQIQLVVGRFRDHLAQRKTQLKRMITYAESDACRRRMILKHFGDLGSADAAVCCDNCQARLAVPLPTKASGELTELERAVLILLDTVRRLPQAIGSEKLARILKGSKARDIQQYGYQRNVYYGRLAVFSMDELKGMISQLVENRYLKVVGGEYPVLRLTPHGDAAIRSRAAIPLKLRRQISREDSERKQAERKAGGTVAYTEELLREGLSVDQISQRRGLKVTTIYTHAAKLIAAGSLPLERIVPDELRAVIEDAIQKVGNVEYLYPIKVLLPEEIDYNCIRCVVESWKRRQIQRTPAAGLRTPAGGQGSQPDELLNSDDPIAAYLSRSRPRQLVGPWDAGWSLGFYSKYSGADWSRSEIGDLVYRLKYLEDMSVLQALVDQALELIKEHPEVVQVEAVLSVPPSIPRANDPPGCFAIALAERLGLAYLPVLVKSRVTQPQKDVHTLAQKRANVAGAFELLFPIKGRRLLVIDDLFDSGATLIEVYRLLLRCGATRVNVMTMTRTIHSDA